mmetsp:Transcript_80096/g.208152  ORF Transcript_80096/g.208152 Transcript_80096/m.208152 type:complete len:114 (-) Transcript_80096:4-345(-)
MPSAPGRRRRVSGDRPPALLYKGAPAVQKQGQRNLKSVWNPRGMSRFAAAFGWTTMPRAHRAEIPAPAAPGQISVSIMPAPSSLAQVPHTAPVAQDRVQSQQDLWMWRLYSPR